MPTVATDYNDMYTVKNLRCILMPDIEKVIFNNPATIVIWSDKTKTVVKVHNEEFDPEKGLAMAIVKKVYGNTSDYHKVFKENVHQKSDSSGNTTENILTDITELSKTMSKHVGFSKDTHEIICGPYERLTPKNWLFLTDEGICNESHYTLQEMLERLAYFEDYIQKTERMNQCP